MRSEIKRLIVTSVISLFLHSFIFLFFWQNSFLSATSNKQNKKETVLKNNKIFFKTVGIPDTNSQFFSQPLKSLENRDQSTKDRVIQKKNMAIFRPNDKKMSLKNLSVSGPLLVSPQKKPHQENKSNDKISAHEKQNQNNIKNSFKKQLRANQNGLTLLNNTDLNFKFLPPKGSSLNQLNTMEKVFYSFQKRTYISFMSSLIRNYQKKSLQTPLIKNKVTKGKHKMTGRITLDRSGNIIAIKFYQWSEDSDIQDLFETTLKSLNTIPNPPNALFKEEEKYDIYCQLLIN